MPEAARARMEVADNRAALRRRRQFTELAFADARVRHCLARAQRRGRANMLIQAPLTAAAMSLRRLVQVRPRWVQRPRLWGLTTPSVRRGGRSAHRRLGHRCQSPSAVLRCDLFALRLRRDSALAFGGRLLQGT